MDYRLLFHIKELKPEGILVREVGQNGLISFLKAKRWVIPTSYSYDTTFIVTLYQLLHVWLFFLYLLWYTSMNGEETYTIVIRCIMNSELEIRNTSNIPVILPATGALEYSVFTHLYNPCVLYASKSVDGDMEMPSSSPRNYIYTLLSRLHHDLLPVTERIICTIVVAIEYIASV